MSNICTVIWLLKQVPRPKEHKKTTGFRLPWVAGSTRLQRIFTQVFKPEPTMIGSLFKATLEETLSHEQRKDIIDQIRKLKGVMSASFNEASKPSNEIWIHTLGDDIQKDVRKIKGVTNTFQIPVM
jgi:hypothetical protein